MLTKQKALQGEVIVTTVLFDNNYELLHDRTDIRGIEPITEKEYVVGGSTALLDAIGKTIHKISKAHKNTSPDYRAGKVLFIITTDGMENASRKYSYDKIKSMIEEQKEKYSWEFIFLGANIDAAEVAERMGIAHDRAANYRADKKGTRRNYEVMSEAISSVRLHGAISDKWHEGLEADE